jgi:hypothetical protein
VVEPKKLKTTAVTAKKREIEKKLKVIQFQNNGS